MWLADILVFGALLLANWLPVDAAVREHHGELHQRGWREVVALALVLTCSVMALWLAFWLFLLLKPYYEYGEQWEGYWVFFGTAFGVLAIYLLCLSAAGRYVLHVAWVTARRMAARTAMYNALVLVGVVLFFSPNY
jgi:hypothetical protein